MSLGRNDSATGVQNRLLGLADQVEHFPEFVVGGLGGVELVAVDIIDFGGEKVRRPSAERLSECRSRRDRGAPIQPSKKLP